jgi:cation diffusion facilitator family transporter
MDAPSRRAERAAGLALAVTCLLAVAKLLVWGATSSIAVLSQALDSALDVVALGLVFLAVRIASKPADATHHYGHAKAENLVAFTQTLFLGVIVIAVAIEAIGRLSGSPVEVEAPWYAFALLAGSVVVDAVRVRWLAAAAREVRSDALMAGALNLVTDVGTAGVVLVSLGLEQAGVDRADAVGGLAVAAAVAVAAWRLGRRSVDVLMDRAPQAPVEAIEAAAARAPGVAETRRVRVRGTGHQLFADVTVAAGRTSSLERAHDIAERVEEEITRVVPGTDVVVHVEPVSETSGLVERVQAAASRVEGIHEIHNVLIHSFNEAGRAKLHVTLHAKVLPGMSLEDAHLLADGVETAVAEELGPDVRVDSHIEPLETTATGRDVTTSREDVVSAVRSFAREEPDIIDCHEVLVTESDSHLAVVAHVRGRGDVPLSRIHEASERIEKAMISAHPEVGSVLIHFEPS